MDIFSILIVVKPLTGSSSRTFLSLQKVPFSSYAVNPHSHLQSQATTDLLLVSIGLQFLKNFIYMESYIMWFFVSGFFHLMMCLRFIHMQYVTEIHSFLSLNSLPLPGGGNGNPLQDSCLGNPMDTGAWWAIIHGVKKESDTTQQLAKQQSSIK